MKYKTLILLVLTFISIEKLNGQTVRFDGLYETECVVYDGEGEQDYLRFYPDGKVIDAGTDCEGDATDLKDWFTINRTDLGSGDFITTRRKIRFTITNSIGSLEYWGRVTKKGLIKLKIKSLVNDYKGRAVYRFVQIDDFK